MIQQLVTKLFTKQDVRQTLSTLRQEIRETGKREELLELMASHTEELCQLLKSEDAKTRKNAALLMGDLGSSVYLDAIWNGYKAEQQRFARSAYLTALKGFGYEKYLTEMAEQLDELRKLNLTLENRKHIEGEMRVLSELILAKQEIEMHKFRGFDRSVDCVFLCSRTHPEVTEEQIREIDPDADIRPLPAGLRVRTEQLDNLMEIRTYSELLFIVPGMATCPLDPQEAAEKIAASRILAFLMDGHEGDCPFYFRLDLKSKMQLDKKSAFAKKMASALEQCTNHQLINSTSHYELEIRLIENKSGEFNTLVRLCTIPDNRFAYRKEHIAASIKPVNAALLVALAQEDMIPDGQILDPFCGVGTMLIERQKLVKGNTSYGIDVLEEAIEKAKINTEAADNIIHYINKDFFHFTHDYLFDEIFTNMPFAMGRKTEDEIFDIYEKFFRHARTVLREDGKIILYTHDRFFVRELAGEYGYHILKEYEITQKVPTHLFVLQ